MKIKIFVIVISAVLFIPAVSLAIMMPGVNLNVVVNAQGGDGSFTFNIKWRVEVYDEELDDYVYVWQDLQDFVLETENSTASYSSSFIVSEGYLIQQAEVPGWKAENIHCASDNPGNEFWYQPNSVIIGSPQPWSSVTCVFNNVPVASKNPVLIVPGLLGTEMFKNFEKLWPDATRMLVDMTDDFMDPLQFNEDLTPLDSNVLPKAVVNRELTFDYTESLINEFVGQEYIENETLFTFPYDWRYGVSGAYEDGLPAQAGTTNVDLLKQKIDDILQQTGANKVDVVAHSLGGLLVKKYAMDNPTDNHIGKAVFVGVPNTGAPKAVKVLLQGDNFGVIGLNDSEIKKISENMPAGYDLLPSQEYYADNGAFVKTINVDVGNLIYEENDLDYQETKSFITDEHNFNLQGMTNAENLHANAFDNFDLRTAGIDLYSINGCKSGTISKITETTKTDVFGYTTVNYDIHKIGAGDGTVTLSSAENLLVDDSNVFYAKYADHGKMPSQSGIKEKIVNIISEGALNTGNNIITKPQLQADPNICELNGFWLRILSPVSISATDQNNNRIGTAEDGSIQNNIPGADYQIMGDHKFVYLPTGENQNYAINLKGEGSGTFTLKNSKITNGQTIQTEVFSNLPVTPELSGQVALPPSAGQPTVLLLDTDGNGTTDQSVEPSSVLDATQSDDLLPPLSTITITGEQGEPSFYRSNVLINIAAEDENSGVLAIEYNLDGAGFQKIAGGTAGFTVSGEGVHTIIFFSTDRAGNNETEKIITFTIDKTPPEAVIEFDPATKDIKFTGQDNISSPDQITIQDNDDTITLTDQAGNTTEIQLKEKDRKTTMKAEIKEIKYNNIPADITKNQMQFSWRYDRSQNLAFLSQRAKQKNNYNISAVYNGKDTRITGKDSSGKIKETFEGLKLIKVITDKGDLGWGY